MMKIMNSVFVVLAVGSLAIGCKVGDLPPRDNNAADAAPDVTVGAWVQVTDKGATPGAGAYMHFVSETQIYAMVGDKICMWDGTAWLPITDAGVTGPYFHFVSETEIYAYIGKRVCLWDGSGAGWIDQTNGENALVQDQGELYVDVAGGVIYSFFSDQICTHQLGGVGDWTQLLNTNNANLKVGGMHWTSPTSIYAVVGEGICKWENDLPWAKVTTVDAPPLREDFVYKADNDIHAVLGQQVCQWDGTAWNPITEDATQTLTQAIHMDAASGKYYVVDTNGEILRFDPPAN
jgi:uncharacterized RmlC-like cupin family protein